MEKKMMFVIIMVLLFSSSILLGEEDHSKVNYIGVGGSNFKIAKVKIVKEVKTRDGIIKSGNRNSNLVEVKLIGETASAGLSLLNPTAFSAVYKFRKFYRIVSAKGVGVKPEVVPGKIVDVLISDPTANLRSLSTKPGEKEENFVYYDIPKEVKEFQILIPALIKGSAKIKK